MKLSSIWIYLGITLVIFLGACGPATPTPVGIGPINNKPIPLPNVLVTVAFPASTLPCVPPVPSIGEVSSYCANQVKSLGGVTFANLTDLSAGGDGASSWLIGDSITGGVSCNLNNGTSAATCSGPPNGTFQAMVCASCGEYSGASGPASFVCANGYVKDNQGHCNVVDPKKVYDFCPAGSLYDNALQNCADIVTKKLASPCPADHPHYAPYSHACWNKVEMAFNCQTFTVQLGACIANKVPVNAVSFCQNKGANIGGLNITIPAGSSLVVDTKGDGPDGCTPGGTQPDGTQLVTCWGASEKSFDAKLCTDPNQPATCTTYKEVLGACPVKKNPNNPAPAPTTCGHC